MSKSLTRIDKNEQELATQEIIALGYCDIASVISAIYAELNEKTSGRIYKMDIRSFVSWMHEQEINIYEIEREHMLIYRKHLKTQGKENITINRMFSVACTVVKRLVSKGIIANDPLKERIKSLATNDESTHVALDDTQSKQLLAAIDTSTIKGKRDYAMVSLMLRSGLRREEVCSLNIGDIGMKQGHHVVEVRHGKGDKPATVKIAPDVWCYIDEYMQDLQKQHPRRDARLLAPLFISLYKGDKPRLKPDDTGKLCEQRMDAKGVENLVKALGEKIGITKLTPHGLRATFITLAMEHDATLEQTQYAARHKDPRTTERYRKRKLNLDKNAVDKLSFLAREEDRHGNADWDAWQQALQK